MKHWIRLLRVKDWYKNVTVLLGFILALYYTNTNITLNFFMSISLALFFTCILSSSNYILNAINDKEYDKKHPIKKNRPLPKNIIKTHHAMIAMIMLLMLSMFLSLLLGNMLVSISLFGLFIASILYNTPPIRLKDKPYADVISESINNPIRFLIGWFIVTNIVPTILLLMLVWVLGGYLMTKKRLNELIDSKEMLCAYRKVFNYYTKKKLGAAMAVYIILSFLFSSFLGLKMLF